MDAKTLVQIVKEAIESKFFHNEFNYGKYKDIVQLQEKKATFVTLNLRGHLRGCIGTLVANRSFLEDLVENAKAAAFSDPRFAPLTLDEYEKIEIEISVLTTPKKLQYTDKYDLKEKIIPFKHGVIIKHSYHQATFLPSVWDQLPQFDEFISQLCQKAGMESNCINKNPMIFTYEAIKYG